MVTTAMIRRFAVQGMTAIMGLMPMAEPALTDPTIGTMPTTATVTLCTLQGIEAFTMAIGAIATTAALIRF